MPPVHLSRHAMATWFEMWLLGEDPEHVSSVGEAVWEEIERVEKMLSRFDPAAEVARVNRSAFRGPVLVDYELFAVLEDCRFWFGETGGFFDVCAASQVPFAEGVQIDLRSRTLRFLDERVQLDFGGYGKGYALDAAARVLDRFGVSNALLHGGTSSVLALGVREDGSPWPVGVRDPFFDGSGELRQLSLSNAGLSTSTVLGPPGRSSDLVDPQAGRPLDYPTACVVVAPTALEAEVLSTALLAMGKPRASEYLKQRTLLDLHQVFWIEQHNGTTVIDELFPR